MARKPARQTGTVDGDLMKPSSRKDTVPWCLSRSIATINYLSYPTRWIQLEDERPVWWDAVEPATRGPVDDVAQHRCGRRNRRPMFDVFTTVVDGARGQNKMAASLGWAGAEPLSLSLSLSLSDSPVPDGPDVVDGRRRRRRRRRRVVPVPLIPPLDVLPRLDLHLNQLATSALARFFAICKNEKKNQIEASHLDSTDCNWSWILPRHNENGNLPHRCHRFWTRSNTGTNSPLCHYW